MVNCIHHRRLLGLFSAGRAQQLFFGHVKAPALEGGFVSWSWLYLSMRLLAESRWVMLYQISCSGP